MPGEEIARAFDGGSDAEPDEPDFFEVWKENAATAELFLELETYWRAAAGPAGLVPLGFDHAGVIAYLRAIRVSKLAKVIGDLHVMERAALGVMRKRSDG